ncbi:MAG: hypothetical protein NTZ14_02665 [Hyphomicrobiales bacterium]|nr:hypothetical protein [Hyphomicrobiales bacterium]
MRGLILVLSLLTAAPTGAQHAGKRDLTHEVAACQAWREHVSHHTEVMVRTGSLSSDEALPFEAVNTLLGRHCALGQPRQVSALFVVVLDLLTDQENQP